MGAFVGIDLGTTYSVVAYITKDGKPEAIVGDENKTITPSVVDVDDNLPIVGFAAKERQLEGGQGIYSFFKRDMGNANVLYMHNGKDYTPIDLSAIVLRYLKSYAEAFLKETVTDAVITVPAYFNNMQREATIAAGKQAGLNVLRIISEPTAAALAYGIRPTSNMGKILVYDLGGGTFDISLVDITPDELRVIATAGDHYLGGKDWDDRILQILSSNFEKQFGTEMIGDEFNDLLVEAEKAKKALTEKQSTTVRIQAQGKSASYEITRQQFESVTADLMNRTVQLVEQVLIDARLKWGDISGVLLVGGSTRMPMVRDFVQRMSGTPPMTGVNVDEAIALGAAIQAAMDLETQQSVPMFALSGRKKSIDVISNSLGMIAENEDRSKYINSLLIRKNEAIPCEQTRPYQLRVSRKGDNKLEVYMTQGESNDPLRCAFLGKYVFSEIPPVQSKVAVIDISYAYNLNGVVEVSAVERTSQKQLKLTVEALPPDVPDRFALPPPAEKIREHLNVYMAFDLSGSMSGEPLHRAQQAAHTFISQCDLSTTSIGVIEFSDSTQTTVSACQDARRLGRGIDDLTIGRTGGGNATDPFNQILGHLQQPKGLRYGIVLTDGVWSDQASAIRTAKRCHEAGIEIIAIGFGGADEAFLKQISSADEYSFFTNLNDLSDTFSTIAQELTEGGGEIDKGSMQKRKRGLRL